MDSYNSFRSDTSGPTLQVLTPANSVVTKYPVGAKVVFLNTTTGETDGKLQLPSPATIPGETLCIRVVNDTTGEITVVLDDGTTNVGSDKLGNILDLYVLLSDGYKYHILVEVTA